MSPNLTFIKDGTPFIHSVKHLLSACEVPVPSIRKHYHEQNRHGPCPCGDHNFNGGGRCHARANIIAHCYKFLRGKMLGAGRGKFVWGRKFMEEQTFRLRSEAGV